MSRLLVSARLGCRPVQCSCLSGAGFLSRGLTGPYGAVCVSEVWNVWDAALMTVLMFFVNSHVCVSRFWFVSVD